MKINPNKINRGSTLLIAIIVVTIGIALIAVLSKTSQRFMSIVGFNKRESKVKLSAQGGIEIALADLQERANKSDWELALGADKSEEEHMQVGLIRNKDWTENWKQANLRPRFSGVNRDGIENKVFYIPSDENFSEGEPYSSIYPKFYHVISESKNTKSGEVYSAESMIYIYTAGSTSMAFGIMNPTLPSNMTEFRFSPTMFEGHVHFGMTDASKIFFDFSANEEKNSVGVPTGNYISKPYEFNGPVTFMSQQPSTGFPFQKDDRTAMNFHDGYVSKSADAPGDNSSLDQFSESINFDEIISTAINTAKSDSGSDGKPVNVDLCADKPSSNKRACIWMNPDGTAQEYTCGTNILETDPSLRYQASRGNTYKWTGDRVFVCNGSTESAGMIEVKGVYKANYTFVADDIIAGGDMVNWDQRDESPYYLGLVAKRNFVIPTAVPAPKPENWYFANSFHKIGGPCLLNENPYSTECLYSTYSGDLTAAEKDLWESKLTVDFPENYYTGITNFDVPSDSPAWIKDGISRRDRDDTDNPDTDFSKTGPKPAGCDEGHKELCREGRAANYWNNGMLVDGNFSAAPSGMSIQRYGEHNAPWILDIDASIVAKGAVKMEGFWNYDDSYTDQNGNLVKSQLRITDENGQGWDAAAVGNGNPKAYQTDPMWTNGPTKPKAAPAYCYRGVGGPMGIAYAVKPYVSCPYETEIDKPKHMLRPVAHSLVLHGSLVTKEYSQLRFNYNWMTNQGFQYTYFYHDPRLSSAAPFGFPKNGQLVVQRLWTKESKGGSSSLLGVQAR